MKRNISEIIDEQYDDFSRMHRTLADFLRENLYQLPFMSINELSERSGVSPASVTRFTRKLGFSGYAEFQQSARKRVQKDIVPFLSLKTVIEEDSGPSEHGGLLRRSIDSNARLLSTLYSEELERAFQNAVQTASKSRRIYVTGHRSSYAVAYYVSFMLHNMRDNVYLLASGCGEFSAHLCSVEPEDCLVAVSYARYTRYTYDIIKYFHEKGCPVTLLTDSASSAVAALATEVLLTQDTGVYSLVSAMTLANAFVTAVGRIDPENTLSRMNAQDAIAIANNIYL